MDVNRMSEDVSVVGQLQPRDLPMVKSLGFRSVVCNRPDCESPEQPLFASIAQAAGLSDIQTVYVPVPPTGASTEQIEQLRAVWDQLPKPVLAYCRSGARSTSLLSKFLAETIIR